MNWLQKIGAIVTIGMISTPIGLETMPIAFFQSFWMAALWYVATVGLIGLLGWSLPDKEEP